MQEPWCHWPEGCEYAIDEANPLTADHVNAVRSHGWQGVLVPMCKRHNSSKGARKFSGLRVTNPRSAPETPITEAES